jgi:hypothetical protein
MKWAVLIMLVLTGLTGCTAYYTQPGKDTAHFKKDKRYCDGVAERRAARNGTRVCDEIDRCLTNQKGWRRDLWSGSTLFRVFKRFVSVNVVPGSNSIHCGA